MAGTGWVLLAYRMPREPSGPRVTVWRKLRRLGAVQVVDGLVALPESVETAEAFGWLAEEVLEAGGEAWTWVAKGSKEQDRVLREQLRAVVTEEYAAVTAEATDSLGRAPQRRTVDRLRRALHDIERRDHVAPKERDEARRAVRQLIASLEASEEPAR